MLVFRCECEAVLGAEEASLGLTGDCPSCGRVLRIPKSAVNARAKLRLKRGLNGSAPHQAPAHRPAAAVALAEPPEGDGDDFESAPTMMPSRVKKNPFAPEPEPAAEPIEAEPIAVSPPEPEPVYSLQSDPDAPMPAPEALEPALESAPEPLSEPEPIAEPAPEPAPVEEAKFGKKKLKKKKRDFEPAAAEVPAEPLPAPEPEPEPAPVEDRLPDVEPLNEAPPEPVETVAPTVDKNSRSGKVKAIVAAANKKSLAVAGNKGKGSGVTTAPPAAVGTATSSRRRPIKNADEAAEAPAAKKGSPVVLIVAIIGILGALAAGAYFGGLIPTGDKPVKTDGPKSDAPKKDAPKTDAPKPDATKADAPKATPPKDEAPKEPVKDGGEAPKEPAAPKADPAKLPTDVKGPAE